MSPPTGETANGSTTPRLWCRPSGTAMSFFVPTKRLVPLARSNAYLSTSGSNESRKLFEAEVTTSGRAAKGHRCAGLWCRWPAQTHYSWCGWRCSPVREVRVELLIVHRVAVGAADLDHGGGQARRHGERAAAQVRDVHRRQERVALHGDCRERSCQEAKHMAEKVARCSARLRGEECSRGSRGK